MSLERVAEGVMTGNQSLTLDMVNDMKNIIDALDEEGLRNQVKVMIGGVPVTQKFSDEIGADLYTVDASSAADEAKTIV